MESKGVRVVVGEEEMRVNEDLLQAERPTLVAGKGGAAITGRPM